MKRSDILYLIVGTNPMPNIITLLNRVNENGTVYLIQSDDDKNEINSIQKIAGNIKSILKDKYKSLRVEDIVVNKTDDISMYNEIIRNNYNDGNEGIVELNFTGGTKFMSSTIYGYFKEKQKNESDERVILSYFDCEKNIFVYEFKNEGKVKVVEKEVEFNKINERFTLEEITRSHGLKFEEINEGLKYLDIANQMFSKFESLTVEGKYIWLKDINELFSKWHIYKKALDRGLIEDYLSKYITLKEEETIFNAETNEIIKYITGDILEEYIFNILDSLKNEGKLDSFVWSYEQKTTINVAGTELDFVILKGLNTFLLSVTLCEDEGPCKFKLYEAKVRAEQVSGDETRIGFVCLYNNELELQELLDGDSKSYKNLVVGIEGFQNIKEKIEAWLLGGGTA